MLQVITEDDVHIYRLSEAIAVYEGLELIMYYKTCLQLTHPQNIQSKSGKIMKQKKCKTNHKKTKQ